MDYEKSEWSGFKRLDFDFEGRDAVVVLPNRSCEGNKWLFKTEYFGAFPSFEIEMLKRGYALAYLSNQTRWFRPDDADSKANFCNFLFKEFGFNKKCLPVGMSCGGMHAVYFAAKYPQYVSALYLDAPVLNLLSCPCGIGMAGDSMYEEFVRDTGMTVSDLINYRNHPIDRLPVLLQHKIPVFLVCGDSDDVVPYDENGAILAQQYEKNDVTFEKVIKQGCGHHPHGLYDNAALIEFAIKNY